MPDLSTSFLSTKKNSRPLLIVAFVVVRAYTFACNTAIAYFRNPQLALFTLYTPEEYSPVHSINTFITSHKTYQNLVPEKLAEGEQRVEISANMPARNSDVDSAVNTVREVEDRFNLKYGYPWVFLNEEPFSDDFKRYAPSHLPHPLAFPLSRASC